MTSRKRAKPEPPASLPSLAAFSTPVFDGPRVAANSDERLFIYSVEKALRILYAFNEADRALSIAAIAKRTGFGRSATQRFVYTLEQLRYLRRDPATRLYSLTPRVLDFALSYLGSDPLVAIALRHMSEASDKCGEAFSLTENDDTENVVVARVQSRHPISVNSSLGMRFPAFCTAPGRAIMAFQPEEQALDIIDRTDRKPLTEHTITDRKVLIALLAEARVNGYAIAEQEIIPGAISIAAPLFDVTHRVVGAVNTFVPITRWPRKKAEKELVPVVRQTAYDLSRSLGTR
ncbi:MAG: IclR family transcriptional regulator [Alphaproteobacteria bacterium]